MPSTSFIVKENATCHGAPSLRGRAGEGGVLELRPRVLGENVLYAPAGPWCRTSSGRVCLPIRDHDGEPAGEGVWKWAIDTPALEGFFQATFSAFGFFWEYDLAAREDIADLCPLAVPILASNGWLLLPGYTMPMDLADPIIGSRRLENAGPQAAWAFGSQGGFLVQALEYDAPVSDILVRRESETEWRVGQVLGPLKAGDRVGGRLEFRLVPFNGAMRLEQVAEYGRRLPELEPDASEKGSADQTAELDQNGKLALEVDGHAVTVKLEESGAPLRPDQVEQAKLEARRAMLSGEDVWELSVHVTPRQRLDAFRIDAAIETPCGNPTWDGDATVFIPGNFARCNYNPNCMHGGGPKWGPGPVPTEREPLTTNDDALGRCHGWTFSSSRLPQVWAAAADRSVRRLVWVGTTPRSHLGDNCAGFVSPEGGKTTLKLASPITYEPWVPLGYSRMRQEPRRDGSLVEAGEPVRWVFYVASRETDDLNAWGTFDRALYRRNRPLEPAPLKITLEEAARACASAMYERFYDAEKKVIVYSTGPQGQQSLVGFTGMAHSGLVMLAAGERFGNAEWVEAGQKVIGTVARMFLQGPGFPWTAYRPSPDAPDRWEFAAASGEPGYVVMAAFDVLAEAIRREQAAGREAPERWLEAVARCARAWVRNQDASGAYPHWGPEFDHKFEKNEYGMTNVEAGVMANMIDAYELLGDEEFLESATKAAAFYGKQLDNGQLWGGPGDIQALVNSEVPMYFLRGFRRLVEAAPSEQHAKWMIDAANWRYSFQYAHSWPVEPGSPLWRQGWAGLGCESASACNLHTVAFGCVNVPDMWALWKLTGDEYHQDRARDLAMYSVQQYARFAGDLGFPFAGAGTESFWASETVWGKGVPWIFQDPGFDLGYMSWVTGWSGYGALWAMDLGMAF